jgi:hypothetical protein
MQGRLMHGEAWSIENKEQEVLYIYYETTKIKDKEEIATGDKN